jgi:hypothetical protein
MPNDRRAFSFVLVSIAALSVVTFMSLTFGNTVGAAHSSKTTITKSAMVQVMALRAMVRYHRKVTWRWQDLSLSNRMPTVYSETRTKSIAYLRWLYRLWAHRRLMAMKKATNPAHKKLWLCIHSKEAAWTDKDPPYWGGLQMSKWFMSTYAPKLLTRVGTADKWHPLQQIWVAERAYAREGYSRRWLFGQWPNTAPPCV